MDTTFWEPEGAERLLRPDGSPADGDTDLGDLPLDRLYRALVAARTLDLKIARLGLPARAPWAGEEAVAAAVALATRPDDWVFPGPRDGAIAFLRGLDAEAVAHQLRSADPAAGLPARDAFADPEGHTGPLPRGLGHHLALATGTARAQALEDTEHVTVATFGEGTTTTGAFHEALSLAAAAELPLVFVCKSLVWPEGAPAEAGTVGDPVYERVRALGVRTVRTDGACAAATLRHLADAVRRARDGKGPALVEVVVTPAIFDPPAERDPVERLRRHLDRIGKWNRTFQDVAEAEVATRLERAFRAYEEATP